MERFTIIIPTHNRPHYLQRILDYYGAQGNGFKIIVADSSSEENKAKNKEIITSVAGLDILYLAHYPEQINPWHKFAEAVGSAESEYCLFCADDDFIIPSAIKKAVDFLEKNPDFTVVQGYYFSFRVNNKKPYFSLRATFRPAEITLLKPTERLIEHLSNYSTPTFCGVHRTDFLKLIFKETLKHTNDGRFGKLLPSMLTLIYGKMKCLDVLYVAKEENLLSGGNQDESISDFIRQETYREKYNKFRKCLTIHLLAKSFRSNIQYSERIIDKAMIAYLKKGYSPNFKSFLINRLKKSLIFLSVPLFKKVRLFYIKIKLSFRKKSIDFLDLENPLSKYHNDFDEIKNCVLSHLIGFQK